MHDRHLWGVKFFRSGNKSIDFAIVPIHGTFQIGYLKISRRELWVDQENSPHYVHPCFRCVGMECITQFLELASVPRKSFSREQRSNLAFIENRHVECSSSCILMKNDKWEFNIIFIVVTTIVKISVGLGRPRLSVTTRYRNLMAPDNPPC